MPLAPSAASPDCRHDVEDSISIEGARQNNLRNLSLELPLGELTVITGVSGSGKSSLAFDTIYAAGRRDPRHPAGDRDRADQPGAHLALHCGHDDRAQRLS